LLPQFLEICEHEPDKGNEPALCDHCAARLLFYAGMIEEPATQLH